MAGTNLFEALYDQTPPASVTSTSADYQQLPAWFQDYQKALLKYAGQSTPTNPVLYQGNRLADFTNPATAGKVETAGFSPDSRAAFQGVRDLQGFTQPYDASAKSMTEQAGQDVTGRVGNYMNPYNDLVTNRLAELAGRDLSERILPQISDTFVGAGQRQGSRQGEFTSRAVRDTMGELLGQQAGVLQSGYNTALSAAQTDQSRLLSAGSQMGALGTAAQNNRLQQLAGLEGVGNEIGAKAQQGADLSYENFTQQRDWNLRNIGALNAAMRGMQVPSSMTQYESRPISDMYGQSPLAAAYGAGNVVAGLPYKRGGRVRGYRRGGRVGPLSRAA